MLFQEYMWNYNKSTICFQLKCMYYLIDAPCMDGLEMWLFQAVKSYVLSYYFFTLSIHTSMQAWANCRLKPDAVEYGLRSGSRPYSAVSDFILQFAQIMVCLHWWLSPMQVQLMIRAQLFKASLA